MPSTFRDRPTGTESSIEPGAPRYLAAPDSFKGTFDAMAVARAIVRGVTAGGGKGDPCPLADGGEGTMDVLLAALGGERLRAKAHDPLGRPIDAAFALLEDGNTAVVEVAQASGLGLVAPGEREPERASTAGTGELIAAAIGAGARRVLVAAGGSATTDGGAGAIGALEARGGLRGAALEVICDVDTPFERAAEVFGPQKGARPEAIRRLTERLRIQADALPRDPTSVPMSGSAGGLSGGLWAAFDARLRPGAAFVLDAVGVGARLRDAAGVISGEGKLDAQSLHGKVVSAVAERCRPAGVDLHLIVGRSDLAPERLDRLVVASVQEAQTLEAIAFAATRIAAGPRARDAAGLPARCKP
jgi:glycerate 2-kinase